jgi:hypothetical protein
MTAFSRAAAVSRCVDYLDFDQKWTTSRHHSTAVALNFGAFVCNEKESKFIHEKWWW